MIEIKNCVFDAQDTAATLKKCTTHGVQLTGSEDVLIENCTFNNRGYSAINDCSEGAVTIKNCVFNCENIYNPIEGSQTGAGTKAVTLVGNTFNGKCGNNYVNFYRFQDGARLDLEDNKYLGADSGSEILRISNMTSASATYNVKGDAYTYADSTVGPYTSYIMCQDYTNKDGVKQDFSKITLNLKNVKCNNEVITAERVAQGKLTFTYEDGQGIIEGNDPVINF